MALVETAKKSRAMSAPGKYVMPSRACKARSPRNQATWAKAIGTGPTAKKISAKGMALNEVGAGNGMAGAKRAPIPICCKKTPKLLSPPRGDTDLGVSSKRTFVVPKSGVPDVAAVL